MSFINRPSQQIFGNPPNPDGSLPFVAVSAQANGETINATTYRTFTGPQRESGRFSVHLIIGAGLTGSITIYYSNLPAPTASAAGIAAGHWVQDGNSSATVTFTGSAQTAFLDAGNVIANYIMVVATVSGGSGTVCAWVRFDGDQG